MQEIMMNKIIPISKKARKKLRLARYPTLLLPKDLRRGFDSLVFLVGWLL
jgi:hypothetical protein